MEKHFKGVLVLNWKSGVVKVMRRVVAKDKYGPSEISVSFDIVVEVPERQIHDLKGRIVLKPEQVNELLIDSI